MESKSKSEPSLQPPEKMSRVGEGVFHLKSPAHTCRPFTLDLDSLRTECLSNDSISHGNSKCMDSESTLVDSRSANADSRLHRPDAQCSYWTVDCSKMYIKQQCDDGLKIKLRVSNSIKLRLNASGREEGPSRAEPKKDIKRKETKGENIKERCLNHTGDGSMSKETLAENKKGDTLTRNQTRQYERNEAKDVCRAEEAECKMIEDDGIIHNKPVMCLSASPIQPTVRGGTMLLERAWTTQGDQEPEDVLNKEHVVDGRTVTSQSADTMQPAVSASSILPERPAEKGKLTNTKMSEKEDSVHSTTGTVQFGSMEPAAAMASSILPERTQTSLGHGETVCNVTYGDNVQKKTITSQAANSVIQPAVMASTVLLERTQTALADKQTNSVPLSPVFTAHGLSRVKNETVKITEEDDDVRIAPIVSQSAISSNSTLSAGSTSVTLPGRAQPVVSTSCPPSFDPGLCCRYHQASAHRELQHRPRSQDGCPSPCNAHQPCPRRGKDGVVKKGTAPRAQRHTGQRGQIASLAPPPCLFAIHMDNVTVYLMTDCSGQPVHLIASTNEIEELSELSVERIQKLKGADIQEPLAGVRVLAAFPHVQVSASGSFSNPVITVEKAAAPHNSSPSGCAGEDPSSRRTGLRESILSERRTSFLMLESISEAFTVKKDVETDLHSGQSVDEENSEPASPASPPRHLIPVCSPQQIASLVLNSLSPIPYSPQWIGGRCGAKRVSPASPSVSCTLWSEGCSRTKRAKEGGRHQSSSSLINIPTDKMTATCLLCHGNHTHGLCYVDKPFLVVEDCSTCPNSHVQALASLPAQLSLVRTKDGFTVCTAEDLPKGTLLGPLRGEALDAHGVKTLTSLKTVWYVRSQCASPHKAGKKKSKKESKTPLLLSTASETNSNWCRYLQPVMSLSHANLLSVERGGKLFFVTCRRVTAMEELGFYSPLFDELSLLPEGSRQCAFCSLWMDSSLDLVKHCLIVHSQSVYPGMEKCSECGEMFVPDVEMDSHGCTQTQDSEQPQRILRCLMRRKSDGDDSGAKPEFPCCKCNKVYSSALLLSRHLLVHKPYYRYFCEFCNKGFHDKSNLKVHVLIHTGVKPFSCTQPQCGASYTTKQCMQNHYRRNHGFTDGNMPEIIRLVPFTLEAHSGSV